MESYFMAFFCKYDDPPYVKSSKIEIMFSLTTNENVQLFLMELKEYSSEIDVEFARKSLNFIGKCALKLESAADNCVGILLELIESRSPYIVQEIVVVIKVNLFDIGYIAEISKQI
jgi:AP-1 complex subunit beta-1